MAQRVQERRRKEIYTYEAPWDVYSLAVSQKVTKSYSFRFAVGSYIEEYSNKVYIVQLDDESGEFVHVASISHPYPTTKISWIPDQTSTERDFIATTGDYLRIWSTPTESSSHEVLLEGTFNSNKENNYCAPLTSFDWCPTDVNRIAACSIDTTVSIWDVSNKKCVSHLLAHDREVYDIKWEPMNKDIFATVSFDGSLRIFDMRSLDRSSILFESHKKSPLLKLSWNNVDPNILATFNVESKKALLLDTRMPTVPFCELMGHHSFVNGIAWDPMSANHICTVGDDSQALIWEIPQGAKVVEEPILAYNAQKEINVVQWSGSCREWIHISFGNKIQMLKV
jgi:DDB1- and CUL4-associated factor 7